MPPFHITSPCTLRHTPPIPSLLWLHPSLLGPCCFLRSYVCTDLVYCLPYQTVSSMKTGSFIVLAAISLVPSVCSTNFYLEEIKKWQCSWLGWGWETALEKRTGREGRVQEKAGERGSNHGQGPEPEAAFGCTKVTGTEGPAPLLLLGRSRY